jgi:hypothetical protein
VTLDMVESRIDKARTQISSATSRDVLRAIRNELAMMATTLRKVKHKFSSIISRRSRLEASCDEMRGLLSSKEEKLPVLSEPVEFDSCEFRLYSYCTLPTRSLSTPLRFTNRLLRRGCPIIPFSRGDLCCHFWHRSQTCRVPHGCSLPNLEPCYGRAEFPFRAPSTKHTGSDPAHYGGRAVTLQTGWPDHYLRGLSSVQLYLQTDCRPQLRQSTIPC